MKICPLRNSACLEENCAWWIRKGQIEEKISRNKQLKLYEHVGCCAIKVIALGRSRDGK